MDIKFYIPENQIVPTELKLYADDIYVVYRKEPYTLAYEFEVYCEHNENKAIEIVKKIAEIMCSQSYDHGSEWRVTEIKPIKQKEQQMGCPVIRVAFRVKDSY